MCPGWDRAELLDEALDLRVETPNAVCLASLLLRWTDLGPDALTSESHPRSLAGRR